jgi:SAM-dependent methyltransferase
LDIVAPVSDVRRSYDAIAERYAREVGSELAGKPLDRALLKVVADSAGADPVVDIGCGPGHVTAYLAKLGVSAVGLDLSPRMCALAYRDAGVRAVAGDMCQLPLACSSVGATVCLYSVIHLDKESRARAYAELFRILRPEGHALIAFHVFDDDVRSGGARTLTEWWDHEVDLTFRYLDPDEELAAMVSAGFQFAARVDRAPYRGVEHPSHRSFLLVRRPS